MKFSEAKTRVKELEQRIMNRIPPVLYCRWYDVSRRFSGGLKSSSASRRVTYAPGGGLKVIWRNGEEFHFAHHQRYVRYTKSDGLAYILSRMMRKYQDHQVTVRPGDIIVEAGANVGEFAVAASVSARGAVVHAYEPDPLVLPSLMQNAALFGNIIVHPLALGAQEGDFNLYISSVNADSSFIEPQDWTTSTSVKVTTVDSIRRMMGRIDFLKVEAEGYEPEVLLGAQESLKSIHRVAVDCGPERSGEPTFEACEALLQKAGFKTWRRVDADHMLFGLKP